jgi:hypothetical protein
MRKSACQGFSENLLHFFFKPNGPRPSPFLKNRSRSTLESFGDSPAEHKNGKKNVRAVVAEGSNKSKPLLEKESASWAAARSNGSSNFFAGRPFRAH